ncbi:hypothetical protein P775_16060 [Puniceibacterium antarcticum]|uniref:Uncharacterized protein n=1 Tax=Puniceibacterium antarcticum TaxID=1206336 RepID=A0A2G8RCN1_9RHOB|nr:hypothetical protein [Puniceibacterium antarcticum]PIL19181.1 hypothetical protein P775_16060 [Puniceibacterium antarcticum]
MTEALRDLARCLYRHVQTEHDHLNSDEVIEDDVIANGYTFTEPGLRFG